ncbi:MAG: glycosyltransferase family 4 protein, partial [Elusimicrobiota bacterium]|nr:glycosyltransferase family 4 protein [Elusimicrobiota bacterium]
MSKKKICMFIQRFHPYLGGTELQALRLSKALLGVGGSEVFILTQRTKPSLKKFEIIDGLPVYRIFGYGEGLIGSLLFSISAFLFLITKGWGRCEVDIIHAHLASSNAIVSGLAGKLLHKKTILKFGGARATGDIAISKKKFWMRGIAKLEFIKRTISCFVCPSEEVKREIIEFGFPEEKIFVIPNGVETEIFTPIESALKFELRQKLNLPKNSVILLYSGRLHPGKGLETLIEFLSELLNQKQNLHLLLVGGGELKTKLQNKCDKLNIKNNVTFTDEIKKEEVYKYFKASDIFVSLSCGEGLSNALLEAMSTGLAVVVTDIDSNKEIIEHGHNGFLVNPSNKQNIIDTILRLSNDTSLRNTVGKNAREEILSDYSIEKI